MDRNSLLSLPFKTSSPPLNWSSIDCCQWEGISCDHKGQVKHIWLPSKGLRGSITPSLANLTHLSHINLSHNSLSGFLPTKLFSPLNQLRIVDFSNNDLNGDISLLFSTNGSSLCINSPFIRFLDFSFNHYSGQVPSGLGGCSELEVFRAGFNSLSGSLPPDIYRATMLHELSLPSNNLSGIISDDIANLTRLAKLELYSNNIGGKLPSNMLNLALNSFEGEISTLNFSDLSQLAVLDLAGNYFTGNLPASLYSCKFLRAIRLSNNQLEEPMPTYDSIVSSSGFANLRLLSLADCQLTGQLPVWLSKLKNLEVLFLPHNRIMGSIPVWLSTLPRLFQLNLADNLLSGEFPKELCGLPALVSPQPLDNTSLDLPIYVTYLVREYNSLSKFRREIILLNNSLSGSIPTEIGHLKQLQLLDLSYNNFFGKIPNQISELTNLERLFLSANQLTGEIPASLGNLHFLNMFRIASNKLHGPIPPGTQLQSFDASDYEGNSGLCGPPLPNQCSHITGNKDDKDIYHDEENRHAVPWLHISIVLGFITGF
ncbi:Receptor-like protein 2 [Morella rubra]|uniref:Receptor-like protein 2 n=1 Tax=Morella rubra TaxID=262757 RepID=A0A6A1VAR4_9ROSI|nr:Receptor-like protein 2 [Morella rubra]